MRGEVDVEAEGDCWAEGAAGCELGRCGAGKDAMFIGAYMVWWE